MHRPRRFNNGHQDAGVLRSPPPSYGNEAATRTRAASSASTSPKAPTSPNTSPTIAIAEELGRTPQSHPRLPHPTRTVPTTPRCFHHLTPRWRFDLYPFQVLTPGLPVQASYAAPLNKPPAAKQTPHPFPFFTIDDKKPRDLGFSDRRAGKVKSTTPCVIALVFPLDPQAYRVCLFRDAVDCPLTRWDAAWVVAPE